MLVKIYWIDKTNSGRLGIMPRPRGGDWLEDEIKSLKFSGVDVVVSLLESEEITELDISDEESLCNSNEIEFLSFPIPDRNIPDSIPETFHFTKNLSNLLKNGKSIVIHCRQGVGRSALIAACVLVLSGYSAEEAFEMIKQTRAAKCPTLMSNITGLYSLQRVFDLCGRCIIGIRLFEKAFFIPYE